MPITQGSLMAIDKDIIKLLKGEGFKTNEAILDALTEFIEIVEDENADMAAGVDELEKDRPDEDEADE
jgi:hypothetical protein